MGSICNLLRGCHECKKLDMETWTVGMWIQPKKLEVEKARNVSE